MQITKAMRYQIIKPLNCSWDEFGAILRDLSYYTAKMCNAAIQEYWSYYNRRQQYKAEHGVYPTDKDLGYETTFRTHVYHVLRNIYPLMASNNVSQINQFALKRWQADLPDIMRLAKSIPSFRLGVPIQVANSNYRLSIDGDGNYIVEVTLLSREAPLSRFTLLVNPGDQPKAVIFRRIVEGTYKQGTMQIVQHKRNKKWFCIISYTFTAEEKSHLVDRVMGVLLGSTSSALYWAFSHSPKRGNIEYDEIEVAQKKIEALEERRRKILRTAGATGHGRKRKLQPVAHIAGKARQIREAINHKYSRRIVDLAEGNRCGIIRLALNPNARDWTWADLVQKITYKALEKGIKVETDEFAKAMSTCSKCGYMDKENVGDNKEFMTCKNPECKARIDLEYNAARALTKL